MATQLNLQSILSIYFPDPAADANLTLFRFPLACRFRGE